ncbi:MAG: hypothetical protein KDA87_17680 [Planctomycetales bacterium]|nr:hypothetical protein [Planctomycetales bacterium]
MKNTDELMVTRVISKYRWAMALLFGFVAFGHAQVRSQDASQAEVYRQWIDQLGDRSFAVREAATRALQDAGPQMLPLLQEVRQSDDMEVRYRANHLIRLFREAHVQQAMDALLPFNARFDRRPDGSIKGVRLDESTITDEALAAITVFDDLELLDLRHTQITDQSLSVIGQLVHLQQLNLRATKITDTGVARLQPLTKLRSLSFEQTQVTDASMQYLKAMQQLQTLYLGGSQIFGPGLAEHLMDLPKLTYLSFENSSVTDQHVSSIVQLKHVETLGLDGTQITDEALPQIAKLDSLRTLWLNKTAVTSKRLLEFAPQIRELTNLHLAGIPIEDSEAAQLQTLLPECSITGLSTQQKQPADRLPVP